MKCMGDPTQISVKLSSKDAIDDVVNKYTLTLKRYYRTSGKEYNDMIKSQINVDAKKVWKRYWLFCNFVCISSC